MSDVNSSLPVRTEAAGDVAVKIVDSTVTSQQLKVNSDGSIDTNILGTVPVSATNLDIRDLSASQDNVAISDGTDTLAINGDGSINATVTATDLDIRDLSHTQDSVKVGDGTDLLAVNADGSINVKIVDGSPGTAINDYNTVAAVAGGATSTHTYTAVADFNLTQIEATGSGKMKIEVQVNGSTKFVRFNSTANPNMTITLTQPAAITSGQTITIIRSNKENQAQDVYSTISGYNA
jgi:hypothetical protein